jgi:hypothetical protein
MKPILALMLSAALAAVPLAGSAQDADAPEDGKSLMEQGAELFLRGLRQEIDPALRDLEGLAEEFGPAMRGFFSEMGPALGELMEQVQDWSQYHPPEIMPNGDIIIRRKEDAPEFVPNPDGSVDL